MRQRVTLVLLVAILAWTTGCGEEARPPTRRLSFVATGLLKGNLYPQVYHYSRGRTRMLGGFASLCTKVRELTAERAARGATVLVDIGGNLAGSAESYASQGQVVVEMMNRLPYAASLISNLEFAHGQEALAARVAQARFPFLASNLTFANQGLSRSIRQEVVREVEGRKVALLGVSPMNLLKICSPEAVAGVTVGGDMAAIVAGAARARQAGAKYVVVLAKIPVDRPLPQIKDAISKSEIDLFVGIDYGRSGFSMERWGKAYVAGVPVDNRGSRLLVVDLEIDGEGRIVSADSSVEIVAPEASLPEPAVARELADYERRTLAPMKARLGTAGTALTRVYKAESILGNVVTDAMREAGGAQIALLNAGATQDDLMPGEISLRDLFRVLPFDDAIVTTQVTKSQLEKLIQEILDRGSRYHVSGASYRVRESDLGADTLLSIEVGGRPADPKATYLLATTDYVMKRSPVFAGVQGTPRGSLRDTLSAYVKKQPGPIVRSVEGRVIFDRPAPVKPSR